MTDVVAQFEAEFAPDCNDCGTRTDLRGFQRREPGARWVVQWVCPECDPERCRLTIGIPDGYKVVTSGPDEPAQLTLTEAAGGPA